MKFNFDRISPRFMALFRGWGENVHGSESKDFFNF